jgi:hypothetical protein
MHIYAINYCFQGSKKAFGKLVGNWKITELFDSERPKIIKNLAIRNHQLGVRVLHNGTQAFNGHELELKIPY